MLDGTDTCDGLIHVVVGRLLFWRPCNSINNKRNILNETDRLREEDELASGGDLVKDTYVESDSDLDD